MKYIEFRGMKIPKISPLQLQQRINKFDSAINEQIPEIERKLKIATGENKNRIEDYKKDVLKMKMMIDKLKDLREQKGIKGKLKMTKYMMIESKKQMMFALKMMRKWKSFDSNIDNFPV